MRVLKWVLLAVVAIPVLALVVGAVYVFALNPKVRPAKNLVAKRDEATVARGRYLAESVTACSSCHTEVDILKPGPAVVGDRFAGREFSPRTFPVVGRFVMRAPNLTPSPEGIGSWTDGELVRAIREGVDKAGRPLIPLMPSGTYAETLTEDDALAIVAYLRTLPPSPRRVPPSEVPGLAVALLRTSPAPVEKEPVVPPSGPTAERGNWLLHAAKCVDCHASTNGPDYTGGLGDFSDDKVFAPNITSDPVVGIGAYTDAELLRVFDEGVNRAGRPLLAMPVDAFKGLTRDDKLALVAALRKIPPKSTPSP